MSRWRLNSFSARLRFARLGCLAAQVAVAKGEEVMKALPKKLLRLTLFGIAVTSLFSVQPVQAFTVTMEQVGSNVVANGSGAINLTGLTFVAQRSWRSRRCLRKLRGNIDWSKHAGWYITCTLDSPDRRVSGAGVVHCQHWQRRPCQHFDRGSAHFSCHRPMSPVLLYRTA